MYLVQTAQWIEKKATDEEVKKIAKEYITVVRECGNLAGEEEVVSAVLLAIKRLIETDPSFKSHLPR
jgi:hypothetical protein